MSDGKFSFLLFAITEKLIDFIAEKYKIGVDDNKKKPLRHFF